jgi:aryl-alcohol dehydrogenase-like predicted oxidoreductase
LLAQKPWIVPIPGTGKLTHLKENLGAAQIDSAFSKITVQGDRLPAEHMKLIDR